MIIISYNYVNIYTKCYNTLGAIPHPNKLGCFPHVFNESEQFVLDTATPARINKLLYKMIDNNQMPKQMDMKHFGQIVSPLAKSLWDDIMEEESTNLPTNWDAKDARKFMNKQFPQYVRKFISEYTDKK